MTGPPETATILLASIALEPNRWRKQAQRVPSFRVSEWGDQVAAAGFDGWELWENHFLLADDAERRALRDGSLPVTVFNTYQRPGIDPLRDWLPVVEALSFLGPQVRGIKFNLGPGEVSLREQVETALEWAGLLPAGVRLLCECHAGTVLESPLAAREAFQNWPPDRFGAILHPLNKDADHCESWFAALGNRIDHLHWQARDGEGKVCPLEAKGESIPVVKSTLQKHGFRGSHSVEFVEGTGQPGESTTGLFKAAAGDLETLRTAQFGL